MNDECSHDSFPDPSRNCSRRPDFADVAYSDDPPAVTDVCRTETVAADEPIVARRRRNAAEGSRPAGSVAARRERATHIDPAAVGRGAVGLCHLWRRGDDRFECLLVDLSCLVAMGARGQLA